MFSLVADNTVHSRAKWAVGKLLRIEKSKSQQLDLCVGIQCAEHLAETGFILILVVRYFSMYSVQNNTVNYSSYHLYWLLNGNRIE